jgi:hypothetical protein
MKIEFIDGVMVIIAITDFRLALRNDKAYLFYINRQTSEVISKYELEVTMDTWTRLLTIIERE